MLTFFNKRLRNRKGFTLIELIVVISIIGILAAIAVPRLGGFTNDAKVQADNASLRTVESAISIAMANGDLALNAAEDGLVDSDGNALANDAAITGVLVPEYIDEVPISQVDSTTTLGYTINAGDISAVFN